MCDTSSSDCSREFSPERIRPPKRVWIPVSGSDSAGKSGETGPGESLVGPAGAEGCRPGARLIGHRWRSVGDLAPTPRNRWRRKTDLGPALSSTAAPTRVGSSDPRHAFSAFWVTRESAFIMIAEAPGGPSRIEDSTTTKRGRTALWGISRPRNLWRSCWAKAWKLHEENREILALRWTADGSKVEDGCQSPCRWGGSWGAVPPSTPLTPTPIPGAIAEERAFLVLPRSGIAED
jgi:hypothetical protein